MCFRWFAEIDFHRIFRQHELLFRCLAASLVLAFQLYMCPAFGGSVGERVPYWVKSQGDDIKIVTSETDAAAWNTELQFWAFDKSVDHCMPITVYTQGIGHGITNRGSEDIEYWLFAYDKDSYPELQNVKLTEYHVKITEIDVNGEITKKFEIVVFNQTAAALDPVYVPLDPIKGEFSFFAFDYDDLYLDSINIELCVDCMLTPDFSPDIYSYYVIIPDGVENMYFSTTPSEDVIFHYDNPGWKLTEEEEEERRVTEIVTYNLGGGFENIHAMTREEFNTTLLSFYTWQQINAENDTSILDSFVNKSFYDWLTEFTYDDGNSELIAWEWNRLKDKIENEPIGENDKSDLPRLNADGLLNDPYSPITVDILYDLHHYRIFVAREAGASDQALFQAVMEVQKASFAQMAAENCSEISEEPIIISEIPEWWHENRVWVVCLSVFTVMAAYIAYGRITHMHVVWEQLETNAADQRRMGPLKGG